MSAISAFCSGARARVGLTGLFAMLALGACDREKGGKPAAAATSAMPAGHPTVTPAMRDAIAYVAKVQLDSGNIAFRAKRYDEALRYYTRAAAHDPKHPSPWFGIFMVGQATGNTALADSAMAMVRQRAAPGSFTDTAMKLQHPAAGKGS